MHQCAIAMSGSYSSAWRHDRSDSWNQNEWICDTPCRKNRRASSDFVVTEKCLVSPIPGSSFAGRRGCAPGGTAQRSGAGRDGTCCFLPAAINVKENPRMKTTAAQVTFFIPASIRDSPPCIMQNVFTRWRRWALILLVCVLGGAAIVGVRAIRTPILRAAGWALVVDEPLEPADIIVIAVDADGPGVLEAADLV